MDGIKCTDLLMDAFLLGKAFLREAEAFSRVESTCYCRDFTVLSYI